MKDVFCTKEMTISAGISNIGRERVHVTPEFSIITVSPLFGFDTFNYYPRIYTSAPKFFLRPLVMSNGVDKDSTFPKHNLS